MAELHREMEATTAEELSTLFWFFTRIRGSLAEGLPSAAVLVDHLRRVLAVRWMETLGLEADATVAEALATISVELAALRGESSG